jgi:membrane-associated protein
MLDFLLHFDDHLREIISNYGSLTYAILFAIIFVETGLVIMPLLPGDSLLFVAGTFAAQGYLDLWALIGLLFVAAVLGDTVNYLIGRNFSGPIMRLRIGKRVLVKPENMAKTHAFFEKHGPKTIILARFVPIIRTFAPFVAGIGTMNYRKFISFNIIGGGIWIILLLSAGYFFGNLDFVARNYEKVILGIIFISVLPILFEFVKARLAAKKA